MSSSRNNMDDDVAGNEMVRHHRPRLKFIQRMLGSFKGMITTVAPVAAGTAVAFDAEVPDTNFAATAAAMIGTKEVLDAMRKLGHREKPLQYLREEGHGSFALGLGKELGKKTVAALPAVGLAAGGSLVFDHFMDIGMADPEHHQELITVLYLLKAPLFRTLMIAAPTMTLYMLGQLIADKCVVKPPHYTPEEHPDTHWYQGLLASGMRVIDAVAAAEVVWLALYAMAEDDRHSRYFFVVSVFMDQFVLEPLRYLSEQPRPFKNITTPCSRPRVVELNEDGTEGEVVDEGNSPCQAAVNMSTRFAIASALFAGAAVLDRFVTPLVSEDPTVWSSWERIGYEALLVAGTIAVEKMIEYTPAAIRAIRHCSIEASQARLFHQAAQQPLAVTEPEYELIRRL